MLTLCLDTSGPWLNLALSRQGTVLRGISREVGTGHSESLSGEVGQMLSSAGVRLSDIQLLAVATGPGSFTGLRVGISFVKGLGAGRGVPCLSVNTLDAMAFSCSDHDGWLSPMIDAKKGEIYTSLYQVREGLPVNQGRYLSTEPAGWLSNLPAGTLLFGSGEAKYRELAEKHPRLRRAKDFLANGMMLSGLARLSARLYEQGETVRASQLAAFYIRPADVEKARCQR